MKFSSFLIAIIAPLSCLTLENHIVIQKNALDKKIEQSNDLNFWAKPLTVDLTDFSINLEHSEFEKTSFLLTFFSAQVYILNTFHEFCSTSQRNSLGISFRCVLPEQTDVFHQTHSSMLSVRDSIFSKDGK